MHVDFDQVLRETIDRVLSGVGLVLIVAFAVLDLVQAVARSGVSFAALLWMTGSESYYSQPSQEAEPDGTLEVLQALLGGGELWLSLGLWLFVSVASLALLVLAIGHFARPTDRSAFLETDRLTWNTANLVAGWICYAVVVLLGLLVLVLPGLVVAALLAYYPIAIAVDDEWFGRAFATSVDVFTEHPGASLSVVFVIGIAWLTQFAVGLLAPFLLPFEVAQVVSELVGAAYWVFAFALLTRTYVAIEGQSPSPDVIGAGVDPRGGQLS